MSKRLLQKWIWLGLVCLALRPAEAQHYLACRGNDLVYIGDGQHYEMKEGVTYQVIGLHNKGGFSIRTPYGNANYTGNRFRVLEGGAYGNATVTVRTTKSSIIEHWQENKMGWRSSSWYSADWQGQVLSSVNLSHCYAAFQWYVNGKPVGIEVKAMGRLALGSAEDLNFSVTVENDQRDGTYSVNIWSGGYELKQKASSEQKKTDSW